MRRYYGPSPSEIPKNRAFKKGDVFIPLPYKGYTNNEILALGLSFAFSDFRNNHDARRFVNHGIVSLDRTMVVIFCDLKGSTKVLGNLGQEDFRTAQNDFLRECGNSVSNANKSYEYRAPKHRDPRSPYPKGIVDKYMGDSAMIYIDLGNTPEETEPDIKDDWKREAVEMAISIISGITEGVRNPKNKLLLKGQLLGVRFGISFGDKIILSVLGSSMSEIQPKEITAIGDFTITGPVVNLAARLEHATPDEFLSAIARERKELDPYVQLLWEKERLRSSALGERLTEFDLQAADLFEVCKKDFEIRADSRFVALYESGSKRRELPWKDVPFFPRGFLNRQTAKLLGGDSAAELFRRI